MMAYILIVHAIAMTAAAVVITAFASVVLYEMAKDLFRKKS